LAAVIDVEFIGMTRGEVRKDNFMWLS